MNYCATHHETPATGRCLSCHKPFCEECCVATDGRSFCGSTCAARHRTFKENYSEIEIRRPFSSWLTGKIIGLGIVAAGASGAVHLAVRFGFDSLARFDWIGRLLK
ncbi:MAG: B-box zinc finger protein [Planctomycetes bacterium]|nr:B-box zinc finger protein [Planctomycetota bacterium]